MTSFLDQLSDPINLRWAWEKVRKQCRPGDHWHDELEICDFELDLDENLNAIGRGLKGGTYRTGKLRPLPFPKAPDQDGLLRLRQSFHVPVRDQIAWVAFTNVIGPHIDQKMPSWSYGNRLFRTMWLEDLPSGHRKLLVGRYRHASGNIYRKFQHSWPRFRRHVALTARKMAGMLEDTSVLEEGERALFEQEKGLGKDFRCPYLHQAWHPPSSLESLHWAGVDIERFYPSVSIERIGEILIEESPPLWRTEVELALRSLLRFEVDSREWPIKELHEVGLLRKDRILGGLPTGLLVAGFLANVSLLRVDREVELRLRTADIAHFRFVDDHVILAYTFEDLVEWVDAYRELLARNGLNLNGNKIEPEPLGELLRVRARKAKQRRTRVAERRLVAARAATSVDPRFPSPLMTTTLGLVSQIAQMNLDLMDESERAHLLEQLEQLLLADFPSMEIRQQTRVSFAAARLCDLALVVQRDGGGIVALAKLEKKSKAVLQRDQEPEGGLQEEFRIWLGRRVFALLLKAIRSHPDRLRLWVRAARFCRLMGVDSGPGKLYQIATEGKNHGVHTWGSAYLKAVLDQTFAEETRNALIALEDRTLPPVERRNAQEFLVQIRRAVELRPSSPGRELRFERESLRLLTFAIWVGREQEEQTLSWIGTGRKGMGTRGRGVGDDELVPRSPAVFQWWFERRHLLALAEGPSAYMASTLQLSEVGDNSAWALLSFYPRHVPAKFLAALKSRKAREPTILKRLRRNRGWLKEALGERARAGAGRKKEWDGPQRGSVAGKLGNSLMSWCDALSMAREEDLFDIRASEWTALEIVRQVIELRFPHQSQKELLGTRRRRRGPPLHPLNYIVPEEWVVTGRPRTWYDWRAKVAKYPIRAVQKRKWIRDSRFEDQEVFQRGDRSLWLFSRDWLELRAVGLLLLGLLGRSFNFPALWNGGGHLTMLRGAWGLVLQGIQCSSRTLGMLEGLLAPRSLETRFFRYYNVPSPSANDDTVFDPPLFIDHDQVREFIVRSQEVLQGYQTSTSDNSPRQLSPVALEQLTWPRWNEEPEEG